MIKKIVFIFFVFIFGILIGILLNDFSMSGRVVSDFDNKYSWTRAICNSENECIDVVIDCKDGKVVNITPIFYRIRHGEDWEDFREDDFCR
jgi:hypothetical protein